MKGQQFSLGVRVAHSPSSRPSNAESEPCSCGGRLMAETNPLTGQARMRCDGRCGRVELIVRRMAGAHTTSTSPAVVVHIDPSIVRTKKTPGAIAAKARAKHYHWRRVDGRTFVGSVRDLVNACPDDLLDASALHKLVKHDGPTLYRGWTIDREAVA